MKGFKFACCVIGHYIHCTIIEHKTELVSLDN